MALSTCFPLNVMLNVITAILNLGKFNTLYREKALMLMLLTFPIAAQIMYMGKWAAYPFRGWQPLLPANCYVHDFI
jgi:hypothetical protein